jgi:hypothetical protein
MGMLSLDSKPRVKTKAEIKQEKIDNLENLIKWEAEDLEEVEIKLKNINDPKWIEKKKKEYKKIISKQTKKIDKLKVKLKNLT